MKDKIEKILRKYSVEMPNALGDRRITLGGIDEATDEIMRLKDKPPIGIMPERLWKEERVWDLMECIARHRGLEDIPVDWYNELRNLLNEFWRRNWRT